jgi:hypothetical protein
MAQVKATVLPGKSFNYKGQTYTAGTEVTFLDAAHAARYEKLSFVKLDKEAHEKVEAAVEKQEKNKNAGPGKTK